MHFDRTLWSACLFWVLTRLLAKCSWLCRCANVRLDQLLYSDTLVMLVTTPRVLWYFPLLQPWRHFV